MADENAAAVPQVQTQVNNIPFPPKLDIKANLVQSWKRFKRVWDNYEIATGLDKKEKALRTATFLTCVGPDALEIFDGFEFENDDDKDVAKVIEKFEKFCVGKTNETYERYLFNRRDQETGETIDAYVSSLRTLSKTCNYAALEESLIRDRIVIGIRDNNTRRKLLQDSKLTLTTCLDICRAAEKTNKQIKEISQEEVQYIRKKDNRYNKHKNETHHKRAKECKFCGGDHPYKKELCPAWGKKCKKCHKTNHFEAKCNSGERTRIKSKGTTHKRKVHYVQEDSEDSDDDFLFAVETETRKERRINALVTMNGKNVDFQLDCGATVNVLPASLYKRLYKDPKMENLEVCRKTLIMFNKTQTKPAGSIYLKLTNPQNRRNYQFKFMIVNADVHPILGAVAIQEMNYITVSRKVIKEGEGLVNQVSDKKTPTTKSDIIESYPEVFNGEGKLPGKLHLEIDESVQPTKIPTRKVPVALKDKVKIELDRLEKKNIITKVNSPTDWISAMVVVTKPSGKIRLCIDPQPLNKALRRNHYPTPTIDDMLHDLQQARLFTVLDAKNGFWQIELDEQSSLLTTFSTPWGRYRWNRMPFGISPAPEEFQRRLDQALEGLPGVKAIHDDILVYGCGSDDSQALQDHDRKLRQLLHRCKEKGICINRDNMKLRLTEVTYMGHIISKEGLHVDPEKVRSIVEMPAPADKTGVQRLLGMVNYVQKFAPNLSELTAPLRSLIHSENEFVWDEHVHGQAFRDIKTVLTDAPVLQYFDQRKDTVLQCDASQHGLGACLLQCGHPIAYASRALTSTEQNYAQIEKELLAVVFGMERFENYTYGREILVESDHKPLEIITRKNLTSAPKRLQRMLLRLQRFTYRVIYKPGPEMYVADTLSRAFLPLRDRTDRSESEQRFESVNMVQNLPVSPERLKRLQTGTGNDENLLMLMATIKSGWPAKRDGLPSQIQTYYPFREELTIQNGLIFKGDRIVIPESERLPLIKTAHSSHIGLQGSLRRHRECMFWPNMNREVTEYISKCEVCNAYNESQCKEPMMSCETPARPWERIACDIFDFNQKSYLMTVDYYSDFFEIDSLHNKTAREIIRKMKANFARHGIPDVLVSDNGPPFASREVRNFTENYEIRHITSSPYHAQSNGKAENAIKTAKRLMRKSYEDRTDPFLALLEWRNTPSEGIRLSPNQRLFGRRTKSLLPMSTSLLTPTTTHVTKALNQRKEKEARYYNRNAKDMPPLSEHDTVRIKPTKFNKEWQRGKVVQSLGNRSYRVETEPGTILRRNRKYLRRTNETFTPAVGDSVQTVPKQEVPKPEVQKPEVQKPEVVYQQPQTCVPVERPSSSPTMRVSTRHKRQPKYLEDFVSYVSTLW